MIISRFLELYQLFLGCCFTSWRGGSGLFQNSQCLTPNPPPLQPFFSCIGSHLANPTVSIYHIDPLRDTVEKEQPALKWVCGQSKTWPSNPSSLRRNKVFVKTARSLGRQWWLTWGGLRMMMFTTIPDTSVHPDDSTNFPTNPLGIFISLKIFILTL